MDTSDLKHPVHADTRIIRVILNGRAASDAQLREAVAHARERGHRVEVRVTWEAGDARRFAAQAAQAGIDTIVAAGGDGTLHGVVNGVVDAGEPVTCSIGVLIYPARSCSPYLTTCAAGPIWRMPMSSTAGSAT